MKLTPAGSSETYVCSINWNLYLQYLVKLVCETTENYSRQLQENAETKNQAVLALKKKKFKTGINCWIMQDPQHYYVRYVAFHVAPMRSCDMHGMAQGNQSFNTSPICFQSNRYIKTLNAPLWKGPKLNFKHLIIVLKGTVSRELRPMLLYIIQKLFSRPIVALHKIYILLKGQSAINKKPFRVS